MGRLTGLLGLVVILAVAWLLSRHKRQIKAANSALGSGAAVRLCGNRSQNQRGQAVSGCQRRRNVDDRLLGIRQQIRIRRYAGKFQRIDGKLVRVSGAADHHLHRLVLFDPLLPRDHADPGEGVRDRNAEGDGRKRRRIAERCGEHFHGPDGSAAYHPAVHRGPDRIGTLHHYGQRHGARVRAL